MDRRLNDGLSYAVCLAVVEIANGLHVPATMSTPGLRLLQART